MTTHEDTSNSDRRPGRLSRTIDRQRDEFFKERKLIDDWVAGRGALILLGMTALLVIFFVLAAFRVPL